MLLHDVIVLLEKSGYQKITVNVPEVHLYRRQEAQKKRFVMIMDTMGQQEVAGDRLLAMMQQIGERLSMQESDCEILNILITKSENPYRGYIDKVPHLWFIDGDAYRLIVYENQRESDTALRESIEKILCAYQDHYFAYQRSEQNPERNSEQNIEPRGTFSARSREWLKRQPRCCLGLVTVNVIIYVICTFGLTYDQNDQLVNQLGLYWQGVFYYGQYYRIFTYMFLHSGLEHLFNNMLILYFVGEVLERTVSRKKYLLIYFTSGIVAGLVSMVYNMNMGKRVVSIGASGAIFGIIGAVAYIIFVNRGRIRELSTRQIVLFVFLSLYGGFTASNVDNAAHIGGFLAGVVLALFLYRLPKRED